MVRRSALFAMLVALVFVSSPVLSRAETITVATYNIEHFESHFLGFKLGKKPEAKQPGPFKDAVDALKHSNDKENFAVARVITHKAFNPDVLVIEEGCTQDNLEFFNRRWLQNAYGTVVQFPSNTDQEQHLCMLLKPGFKILERRDKYRDEKDSVANERGDKLFARGPVFCLVQTPAGYKFWIGVTHQKSKYGNNLEVTQWRNRESVRTHKIMLELQKQGPTDVMLLGDMNDELGEDEQEKQPNSGGDSIANLVGPASDGFMLVTEQLAKSKQDSFGGYWNPRFRSFIDHVIVTPSMKDQVRRVEVFYGSVAPVASDHFPVFVKIHSDGTPEDAPTEPAQPTRRTAPPAGDSN